MAARTTASQCLIVAIDPPMAMPKLGTGDLFSWLASVSQSLNVPSLFVGRDKFEQVTLKDCLQQIGKMNQEPRRTCLLVMGADLGNSITLVALEALATGYDVYLLGDLIASPDKAHENLYWQRLIQAGAVPTTMTQMLAEWLSAETVPDNVENLRLLKDAFLKLGEYKWERPA